MIKTNEMARMGAAALATAMQLLLGAAGCAPPGEGEGEDEQVDSTSAAISYGALEYDEVTTSSARKDISFSHNTSWGAVGYEQYGDQFWLLDTAKDGNSVGIYWRIPAAGRHGICRNARGVQYEAHDEDLYIEQNIRDARYRCDKNFPEDKKIEFKLGRCNGTTDNCKVPGGYRDWTVWFGTRT